MTVTAPPRVETPSVPVDSHTAADLTRRLDEQVAREAEDRRSRLAAGLPDFERWPR